MKRSALGMIETLGYIGAIAGADAAVKAAVVEIRGLELVKGGIVTVLFSGDVGAVKAAVEAGSAEASRVGTLLRSHVIARVSDELEMMMEKETKAPLNTEIEDVIQEAEVIEEATKEVPEVTSSEIEIPEKEQEILIEEIETPKVSIEVQTIDEVITAATSIRRTREALSEMKVVALRNIARNIENIQIDRNRIKFSNKAELINAILASYDRR